MAADEETIRGTCFCEGVVFEITAPAKFCVHCHCTMCRRLNGAAFVTWAGFADEQVKILKGQALLKRFQSSSGGSREFCGKCGSQLFCYNDHMPGVTDVVRAALPDGAELPPRSHVYYSHKAPWFDVNDDLTKRGGETGTEPLEES